MKDLSEFYNKDVKSYSQIDPRDFDYDNGRLNKIYKRYCYTIILSYD